MGRKVFNKKNCSLGEEIVHRLTGTGFQGSTFQVSVVETLKNKVAGTWHGNLS